MGGRKKVVISTGTLRHLRLHDALGDLERSLVPGDHVLVVLAPVTIWMLSTEMTGSPWFTP